MIRYLYEILYYLRDKKFSDNIYKIVYKVIKLIINSICPIYYRLTKGNGIDVSENKDNEIIISLTTFPERIDKVWIVIESLMRQTVKPNKIILWLAKNQFNNENKLPNKLLKQKNRGLTIEFCDDLKSHKKYYYTMKQYSNSLIITVDDDIFYPENLVEELIKTHYDYPDSICCNLAYKITFDKNGKINSYSRWLGEYNDENLNSYLLCPIGCQGVLYPPKSLDKRVFEKEIFKELCPNADDLWLKVMAILNIRKTKKVRRNHITYVDVIGSQKISLNKVNVGKMENDLQLEKVIKYFNLELRTFEFRK